MPVVRRAPQTEGTSKYLQARRGAMCRALRRHDTAGAHAGPPPLHVPAAPGQLRALPHRVLGQRARGAPRKLRPRAHLLREQVRRQGAAPTHAAASAAALQQAPRAVQTLRPEVHAGHGVRARRGLCPCARAVPAAVRRARAAGPARRAPAGPLHGRRAALLLQGRRM